jgi:hypothetical protein
MTRSIIFILGLSVAAAFPAAASANCGSVAGPYSVTCEQGVQVYRHNALSGIPHRLTQAEAAVQPTSGLIVVHRICGRVKSAKKISVTALSIEIAVHSLRLLVLTARAGLA